MVAVNFGRDVRSNGLKNFFHIDKSYLNMAQARRTSAMETLMQTIVDRGTLPQRRATSQAQFVRAPDGREITLQKTNNQLTPEGKAY